MRRTLAIAWCDLRAFLLGPAGWLVPAMFLFASGLIFMQAVFRAGHPASMQAALGFNAIFLLMAGPAIVMGAICESRRQGTFQLLQASPASNAEIILGKWLGGLGVLLLVLMPTLIQVLLLEWYGRPDLGAVGAGYLGLVLLGAAVVASGILVSALVASQTVAFLLTCGSWVLISVILQIAIPNVLEPVWAIRMAAVDPLARLADFTLGLLDTASIGYFISLTVTLLVLSVLAIGGRRGFGSTLCGVLGIIALLVAFNVLLMMPMLRGHVDATKSRMYSLSPSTQTLIESLEDAWSVQVLLNEQAANPATVRQIDEVLRQFEEASPMITADRLDPTKGRDLSKWEVVLDRLRRIDREDAQRWEEAIEQGRSAFAGLLGLAELAAGPIRSVSAGAPQLNTSAAALALLAAEGHRILQQIDEVMTTDAGRPLPDRLAARLILQQLLSNWAIELETLASQLQGRDALLSAALRSASLFERSRELSMAADALARLPDLTSADMARHLESGEAAIVIGGEGARIIPITQLVPATFVTDEDGRIAFDQRFRGEQLIASAMRSLQEESPLHVVFVHAGDRSVLNSGAPDEDVAAVSSMLRASGMVVQEWQPHLQSEPPKTAEGHTAWIILPPVQRGRLEPESSEQVLLKAATELLVMNEPVMLNLFPSQWAAFGGSDPWVILARQAGATAMTDEVLLRAQGEEIQSAVELADFPESHPLAAAMHGQSLILPMATPLESTGDLVPLAMVEPAPGRWRSSDWRSLVSKDARLRRRAPTFEADLRLESPTPVILAGTSPSGGRVIVIGSGNWMRTRVADAAASAGGARIGLLHPGNHELAVSGAAWLAGADDRLARGALSQDLARLGRIPSRSREIWGWILLAGLPCVAMAMGTWVWFRRRY